MNIKVKIIKSSTQEIIVEKVIEINKSEDFKNIFNVISEAQGLGLEKFDWSMSVDKA